MYLLCYTLCTYSVTDYVLTLLHIVYLLCYRYTRKLTNATAANFVKEATAGIIRILLTFTWNLYSYTQYRKIDHQNHSLPIIIHQPPAVLLINPAGLSRRKFVHSSGAAKSVTTPTNQQTNQQTNFNNRTNQKQYIFCSSIIFMYGHPPPRPLPPHHHLRHRSAKHPRTY